LESSHPFQVGDEVYYTPGFGEFGSYAQYHVAEESIVAVKPINLTHVDLLAVGKEPPGIAL